MKKQVKSKKLKIKSKIFIFSIFAFFLLPFAFASAHPGATDAKGCHKVTRDYQYIGSKKILKAGTTHCHAGIGKMKLGSEVLEDPYDAAEEVKGKVKSKK